MGDEKVEQNAGRLGNFIFSVLGCDKKNARRVIKRFIEKYLFEEEDEE